MAKQERKVKVIIIGAGAAGLGAAQHLTKNGFNDFVILEASDRIGGRIHTIPFGSTADNLIELGANWIHGGTIANPILTQMVQHFSPTNKERKIPYLKRFDNICFAKSNGRLVSLELGMKALDSFFEVERAAYKVHFSPTSSKLHKENLIDFMKENLEKIVQNEFPDEDHHDVRGVFNSLLSYLSFHVGDDLNNVSLREYGSFQEIPGGDVILPGGFQNLIQTLANGLPTNTIFMNHHVKEISWPGNEESIRQRVRVTCENGSQWQADHAIVTVPLGYLKKHYRTLFNPRLPQNKEEAIQKIGFGCTNKIFLEFDRPFWNPGSGNIGFCWTKEELDRAKPEDWETAIYGLEEVYDNPNVLAAWLAGRSAEIMETVPEQEVSQKCLSLLTRFTGNENIPPIKRVVRSTWRIHPLFGGSYSYATPKSGKAVIQCLAQPLPTVKRPALMFAGEATHNNFYSTVHGAYLSGIREAQIILNNEKVAMTINSRL